MRVHIDIDFQLSRRQRTLAIILPALLAIGSVGIVNAAPEAFVENETLTAAKLNANFNDLHERLDTAEQTLVDGVPLAVEAEGAAPGTFNVPGTLGLGLTVASGPACVYNGGAGSMFTDCSCPAGSIAISAGVYSVAGWIDESANVGAGTGALNNVWRMACKNSSGTRIQCTTARAYCARVAPLP